MSIFKGPDKCINYTYQTPHHHHQLIAIKTSPLVYNSQLPIIAYTIQNSVLEIWEIVVALVVKMHTGNKIPLFLFRSRTILHLLLISPVKISENHHGNKTDQDFLFFNITQNTCRVEEQLRSQMYIALGFYYQNS